MSTFVFFLLLKFILVLNISKFKKNFFFSKSVGDTNITSSGVVTQTRPGADGLWDITSFGRIKQTETTVDPADVRCLLYIPNTTYSKQTDGSEFSKLNFAKTNTLV